MDQNGDGLICNNDLFNVATVSTVENPLISKDIYKIYEHISGYRNRDPTITIVDTVSDEELFKA
jgi:hypothetical protein